MRAARPKRRETHARAAGQASVGVGHERRALLMARRNEGDPGLQEGIENVQGLLPGQTVYVADLLVLEALDDQVRGFHAIQTDLMLTNSRMPYSESSRPSPRLWLRANAR